MEQSLGSVLLGSGFDFYCHSSCCCCHILFLFPLEELVAGSRFRIHLKVPVVSPRVILPQSVADVAIGNFPSYQVNPFWHPKKKKKSGCMTLQEKLGLIFFFFFGHVLSSSTWICSFKKYLLHSYCTVQVLI